MEKEWGPHSSWGSLFIRGYTCKSIIAKYILKLKREIVDGTISYVHGNKNRKPVNAISEAEELQIINLYQRSHASVKKFAKFYGKRSYSCIYTILKKHNLI